MNQLLLQKLRCRKCGRRIELKYSYLKKSNSIIHGLASCGCTDYPIINGILLTVEGEILEKIRKYSSCYSGLLNHCSRIPLFIFGLKTTKFFANFTVFWLWFTVYFPIKWYIFLMVLLRIWNKQWANRIIRPGFNESDMVADKHVILNSSILDIGCGACDFELRHIGEIQIVKSVGVDIDLFVLYLVSRYRKLDLNLWWGDINSLAWWFDAPMFDMGVCIDGFQYIRDKSKVLEMVMPVLSKQGSLMLTNIHLATFFPNMNKFHHALSKEDYFKLFSIYKWKLYEQDISKVIHVSLMRKIVD
jgi:SAM-dependent methyltransferase